MGQITSILCYLVFSVEGLGFTSWCCCVVDERMLWKLVPWFVVMLMASAWANPLLLPPEHTPLASELSSRVMERASRLQDSVRDPRFPLPSAQDLEAIRRVAQVLIMLGEQVIPAIIGDPTGSSTTTEIPYDTVNNNKKIS